jgi:hypothetical protein
VPEYPALAIGPCWHDREVVSGQILGH